MSKKLSEFRAMASEELGLKIVEMKAELAKERALIASGTKAQNPGKISITKKTIARLMTIIKEKQKQLQKAESKAKTEKVVEKQQEKVVEKKTLIKAKK